MNKTLQVNISILLDVVLLSLQTLFLILFILHLINLMGPIQLYIKQRINAGEFHALMHWVSMSWLPLCSWCPWTSFGFQFTLTRNRLPALELKSYYFWWHDASWSYTLPGTSLLFCGQGTGPSLLLGEITVLFLCTLASSCHWYLGLNPVQGSCMSFPSKLWPTKTYNRCKQWMVRFWD